MCGLIFLSFGGEDVANYAFRTMEDRQKIEKLWEDGQTPKEISETTGVSIYVVYNELANVIIQAQAMELAQHDALTRAEEIAALRQKYAEAIGGPVDKLEV